MYPDNLQLEKFLGENIVNSIYWQDEVTWYLLLFDSKIQF